MKCHMKCLPQCWHWNVRCKCISYMWYHIWYHTYVNVSKSSAVQCTQARRSINEYRNWLPTRANKIRTPAWEPMLQYNIFRENLMIFQQNVSFFWSCYLRLVPHILQSKLLASLKKARCIVHFSAAQREKSVSVSVRGSATGLLIAVEPKSSPGQRRFGGAENSSCQSPGCTWVPSNWARRSNCWQHSFDRSPNYSYFHRVSN